MLISSDKKRIWIVCTGEPTPIDGQSVRLFRAGLLAEYLAERGFDVTWWVSAFFHRGKSMRLFDSNPLMVKNGFRMFFLPALGYKQHLSARRLTDHAYAAFSFLRQAKLMDPPDAIYVSYPTLELSVACAKFACSQGINLCIDVRDLWPDVFYHSVDRRWRPFIAIPIALYSYAGKYALRQANTITSVTEPMLNWALDMAGRERGVTDAAIPFPHAGECPSPSAVTLAVNNLKDRGLNLKDNRPRVLYCGSTTSNIDVETLIEVSKMLSDRGDIQIVIFGAGTRHSEFEAAAKNLDNLYVGGWVDIPKIAAVANYSAAGLLPYRPTFDFEMSIPNKVSEYLYYGLPIISSLHTGPVSEIIGREAAGVLYEFGNKYSLVEGIIASVRDWRKRGMHTDVKLKALGRRLFGNTTMPLGRIIEDLSSSSNSYKAY